MHMFVSSKNRGSIKCPCVFAARLFRGQESQNHQANRLADRRLGPWSRSSRARLSHPHAERSPLPYFSAGTVLAGATPDYFLIGILLRLPRHTSCASIYIKYIRRRGTQANCADSPAATATL